MASPFTVNEIQEVIKNEVEIIINWLLEIIYTGSILFLWMDLLPLRILGLLTGPWFLCRPCDMSIAMVWLMGNSKWRSAVSIFIKWNPNISRCIYIFKYAYLIFNLNIYKFIWYKKNYQIKISILNYFISI